MKVLLPKDVKVPWRPSANETLYETADASYVKCREDRADAVCITDYGPLYLRRLR